MGHSTDLAPNDLTPAIAALLARPLAIAPEYLQPFLATIAAGQRIDASAIEAAVAARGAQVRSTGGTAVIQIVGPLQARNDMWAQFFGLPSYEGIRAQLRAALADDTVTSIVLDVDSPGGDVQGCDELAAEIFAARDIKPITALANGWGASAAYYLASQASELVVIPSGMIGSIGVITIHADYSRALDMEGITPTVMTAGRYKGEMNPWQPLSAEAEAHTQAQLNTYYDMFVAAVARGRKVSAATVRNDFGEGRMVMAAEAVSLGMADRIGTADSVMQAHSGRVARAGARAEADQQITTEGDPSDRNVIEAPSTEALYALVRSR